MGEKLSKFQIEMLRWYADRGPTTQAFGRLSTWSALRRRGLLSASWGLGPVTTEITDAGRAALSTTLRQEGSEGG